MLSLAIILSASFVACKHQNGEDINTASTTLGGNAVAEDIVGFEDVEVTDEKGKTVTEKDGKAVTKQVAVEYVTNKKGKTVAREIDEQGNPVTNKKGKEVTHDTDVDITPVPEDTPPERTSKKEKTPTEMDTKKDDKTTKEYTTKQSDKVDGTSVPKTTNGGERVIFSAEDQQKIKEMLEVPYLYAQNYENADGVPIEIATHAAIWMAEREGLTLSTYATGTIVLDLFKYFGQTVMHFKTKCNSEGNNPNIVYNPLNNNAGDTFTIKSFEEARQTVTLTQIEDLKNNYYKVTASVHGVKGKRVVYAIVQRNNLDATLKFSIKALRWE